MQCPICNKDCNSYREINYIYTIGQWQPCATEIIITYYCVEHGHQKLERERDG